MDGGSACVQRPYDWLEITSMEAFQKPHFVTFWTRRTSLNFIVSTGWTCTSRHVLFLRFVGRGTHTSMGNFPFAVDPLQQWELYLMWTRTCLLFKYSCLFWSGVGQIRRTSGSPTWTWTVSSMRKIHRNIEDKSWFLLENNNARLCHLVAWTRFRPCSDGVAMW